MSHTALFDPEIFDPEDDDMEPMRIYEPAPKLTFEEEQKINELAELIARNLSNDEEFAEWLNERDAETIAYMNTEVN